MTTMISESERRQVDVPEFDLARKILFWSDERRPQSFEDLALDLEPSVVLTAVRQLQDPFAFLSYRGSAGCRICGRMLGFRTYYRNGFAWPESAEHYVLEHGVWTPGLTALVESARRRWP